MKDKRPDPEKLLKRIQEDAQKELRGKLKIYLGAAPGVGKTYSMLQDAYDKFNQGLDVVVGIVETHGRKEIEFILKDYEVIPRQSVEYKGQSLLEFDLDGALLRNPGLLLVDEMAHTNVSGLRHAKRWQDIKELLDRGINVYTTLNVQHVESLNDVVSQIININILETVPDSMIELADTLVLVDLPAEDLLKRLQAGKVYFPAQAQLAAEHFFRRGNLNALRELALRVTADRVSSDVLHYRQGLGIKYIWPTKDKLLVCVSSTIQSAKLIRAACRMATRLKAEWIAVHVDSAQLNQTYTQRKNALENLQLAEKLGADVRTLTGFDIVKEIMTFAREQNITQIIVWKRVRPIWKSFFSKSLADEIIRHSNEIDVYVITGELDQTKLHQSVKAFIPPKFRWKNYFFSAVMVIIATGFHFLWPDTIGFTNLIFMYVFIGSIFAITGQMGPSLFVAFLSISFCLMPLFVSSSNQKNMTIDSVISLVLILLIMEIISYLTIITRNQANRAKLSEQRTARMNNLSRQLASTRGVDELLNVIVNFISDVFSSTALIVLEEKNQLVMGAACKTERNLNEKEWGVAQWVFDLGQVAGLGTDTLPFSDALYIPLLGLKGPLGVLRLSPLLKGYLFTVEEKHLLESFAKQSAIALEVEREQQQKMQSYIQTEKYQIHNNMLESISKGLHQPIQNLLKKANSLKNINKTLKVGNIETIRNTIYVEFENYNNVISNLIKMAKIDSNAFVLQKKLCDIADIINKVLFSFKHKTKTRSTTVLIAPSIPKLFIDEVLIEDVLFHLLDNAIKFTSATVTIQISVVIQEGCVVIKVEDAGEGILLEEKEKIFEKFYRSSHLSLSEGVGLGLAICYRIIKAHQGEIWAEASALGGAAFCFTLLLD